MKKTITFVLLLLGIVIPNLLQAQITYGLRVGVSSNQMVNSPIVFPVINDGFAKVGIGSECYVSGINQAGPVVLG